MAEKPHLFELAEEARTEAGKVAALFGTKADHVRGRLPRLEEYYSQNIRDGLIDLKQMVYAKPLTLKTLPENLSSRFVGENGELLVIGYPKSRSMDKDTIDNLKRNVRKVSGAVTGLMFPSEILFTGGIDRMPYAVALILLFIFALLIWDLRSIKHTLVALVPLCLGSIAALGLVVGGGATVSVLMMTTFPLLFGIGIDDGVHIIHRHREADQRAISQSVAEVSLAIFFTSLTTFVSFGVLFFTNHSGLEACAWLITTGVALCWLTSVTVLPSILRIVDKGRRL